MAPKPENMLFFLPLTVIYAHIACAIIAIGFVKEIVMITDIEIKLKGVQILAEYLGDVETERFIALIQREPFDYTKWRQGLDKDLTIENISQKAMALRKKNAENSLQSTDNPCR